jgi:hypothetical protein
MVTRVTQLCGSKEIEVVKTRVKKLKVTEKVRDHQI